MDTDIILISSIFSCDRIYCFNKTYLIRLGRLVNDFWDSVSDGRVERPIILLYLKIYLFHSPNNMRAKWIELLAILKYLQI